MIIACPACATRYVVPDSAVGVEGRTVRCAKCRHSWFQDGHRVDRTVPDGPSAPDTPAAVPVVAAPDRAHRAHSAQLVRPKPPAGFADAAGVGPACDPLTQATVQNSPETVSSPPSIHEPETEYSQFEYQPPFHSRRNPLRIWTGAAVVFAVIALGTIAAVSFWGPPPWFPFNQPTFAASQPDLVLDFPPAQQDRRTLPNGSEFFGAVGTITNVGRERRNVPSILIVMRDEREKIVYSWVLAPSRPTLAPGEKMTVVEAVTDVPKSAKFVEIGWKPG